MEIDRAQWLANLKPGDVVVTVTAKSGKRVRVERHKITKDSDAHWIRLTNCIWRLDRSRTDRSGGEYLLPDEEDAIAAESTHVLRQARIRWMAYKMACMTDYQLDRIEAIQKEYRPRKK